MARGRYLDQGVSADTPRAQKITVRTEGRMDAYEQEFKLFFPAGIPLLRDGCSV